MRGLVVDPSNPDRFYLGTLQRNCQIYTSADGGKTWQLLYNFNKPKLLVDHIIVDPRRLEDALRYCPRLRHERIRRDFSSQLMAAVAGARVRS